MANGNGGSSLADIAAMGSCSDFMHRIPRQCQTLPFTIFFGAIPTTVPVPANLPGFIFPTMRQILPINYKRVAVFFRSQFAGVYLATMGNGQGVSIQQCFGNDPNVGGNFETLITAGDPEGFVIDPWFVAAVSVALPPPDNVAVHGYEIVQVG